MTSRDFCFWLQGYFELGSGEPMLDPHQVACIKRHLAMVFIHEIDPSFGGPEKQAALDVAHKCSENHDNYLGRCPKCHMTWPVSPAAPVPSCKCLEEKLNELGKKIKNDLDTISPIWDVGNPPKMKC